DWVWLFFFSSRRRHTRFSRDWSSDVCSSDLHGANDVGVSETTMHTRDNLHSIRCNKLRPVDQGETFFGSKPKTLHAFLLKEGAGLSHFPFHHHLTLTDEGKEQMRKRCQVARRTH